jgi:hypothetical protein
VVPGARRGLLTNSHPPLAGPANRPAGMGKCECLRVPCVL